MQFLKNFALLIGRTCLSVIFLSSGFDKIMHFSTTLGYMASKGMPFIELLLICAIIIEILAGLMILIGWHARWAAAVLLIFIIVVTLVFHRFWSYPPVEAASQTINFLKNLAIIGAMLYIIGCGAGSLSFDGLRQKKLM